MGLYPESRVEGADISHRGGAPGFVYVQDKSCLILPDYSGNKYFNTIGNVLLNPQVALLFINYETARVLWIRANAELNERQYLDIPQFADAERLLVLQITACRLATNPVPLQWLAVAEPNSEESLMQN
ncbi:pyridoxamine 5'-phosphate oxidase family protein [bacterium]|nr:pyridoxamine 5'-phosphate oxidase family protein [bacterium]